MALAKRKIRERVKPELRFAIEKRHRARFEWSFLARFPLPLSSSKEWRFEIEGLPTPAKPKLADRSCSLLFRAECALTQTGIMHHPGTRNLSLKLSTPPKLKWVREQLGR